MKTKILIILIVLLFLSTGYFFLGLKNLQVAQRYENSVPHIELGSIMIFYGVDKYEGKVLNSSNPNNIGFGSITGFVKLLDIKNQPRNMWQYYTIEATEDYNSERKQIFTIEEQIKLPALPPKRFEKQILTASENNKDYVILESEYGDRFKINKIDDSVAFVDAGGDKGYLITKDKEYRDFMFDFLGN